MNGKCETKDQVGSQNGGDSGEKDDTSDTSTLVCTQSDASGTTTANGADLKKSSSGKKEKSKETQVESLSAENGNVRQRAGSARKLSFDVVNLSILVVDDDPVARRMLSHCLSGAGYENITCCASGEEAYDLLMGEDASFHLSLVDVHMPGIDGFELLRRIRIHKRIGAMPVIMMSAADEMDIVFRCLQCGADDYILKPIRKEVVQNLWSNVWRKRRDQRKMRSMASEQNDLSQRLGEMSTELQALRCQVDEAVETPINVITRTISNIVKTGNLTPEVRHTLSSIVKSLGASNLYQPAFRRYFAPNSAVTPDIDDSTRRWLESELSIAEASLPRSADAASKGESEDVGVSIVPSDSDGLPQDFAESLRNLRSWDFDVHAHSDEDLSACFPLLLRDFGLIKRFRIDPRKLISFLHAVRNTYKFNPYHNFRHAWDVMQCSYMMLRGGRAADLLTPLETLALLVASLCHDLDHPGLNNSFQISTRSALAMRYNDLSVLENHHCAEAFRILAIPECNIFENLTPVQFKEARRLIISSIIATDLARYHVEICTKFKSALSSFSKEEGTHRELLMQIILKCADVSNPARPFQLAAVWARKVMREFFEQGDAERSLNLEVSPMMDRHTVRSSDTQAKFIHFVVEPLFKSVCELLPEFETTCSPCEHLARNKKKWKEYLIGEERGIASPATPCTWAPRSMGPLSPTGKDPSPSIESALQKAVEKDKADQPSAAATPPPSTS